MANLLPATDTICFNSSVSDIVEKFTMQLVSSESDIMGSAEVPKAGQRNALTPNSIIRGRKKLCAIELLDFHVCKHFAVAFHASCSTRFKK